MRGVLALLTAITGRRSTLLAQLSPQRLATDVCWAAVCQKTGARELIEGVDIEVRPSIGKGDGLFAARDLADGTLVVRYSGALRTREDHLRFQAEERDVAYAFRLGLDWVIDGAEQRTSGVARYVNHSCRRKNCEAVPVSLADVHPSLARFETSAFPTQPFAVFIETTRDIGAGEEILIDYGTQYWASAAQRWPFGRLDPRRLAIDYL